MKCPSEQKSTNEHGSSTLHASKSGKGGGGVEGDGGGGEGKGKSLWSLKVDESSDVMGPGPQSVLCRAKGPRGKCAQHRTWKRDGSSSSKSSRVFEVATNVPHDFVGECYKDGPICWGRGSAVFAEAIGAVNALVGSNLKFGGADHELTRATGGALQNKAWPSETTERE